MKKCVALLALLCVGSLGVGTAQAEIKGTYQLHDGQQMQLFYRNDQQIRMTLGEDAQLVLKDGKTWMLNRQGGQWLALDMAQVGGLMQAMRKPAPLANVPDPETISMRSLGREETVAGYTGEVWELSDGSRRYELVLSRDADVRALTDGWRQVAGKLAATFGEADAQQLQEALEVLPKGQTGLLRQGDNFILIAVDKQVSAADVDFPPGTQTLSMPSLPGF